MRAYLKYLLLFFVVASTVAKRDDEDDYDDEEEESWSTSNAAPPTRMLHVKMPNSKPQKDETYLCAPYKLSADREAYIVGFHPNATSKIAHHIVLTGCQYPGREDPVFNCGAMTERNNDLNTALRPCGLTGHSEIIYAWAKNAPNLELPADVAFRISGDTKIRWLVLQVHYASVKYIPPTGDVTSIGIEYQYVPRPKAAGVLFLGTNGRIPAKSTTHMEVACGVKESKTIHPFAFRVHTHSLGRVVSGWKVQESSKWTLLGKESPQLPQMFYPLDGNEITLTKGDTVAARCTMENDKDHAVWVGTTREDEMCNFYLMYWMHGRKNLDQKVCQSVGPPIYYWDRWLVGGGLSNVPADEEASEL